MDFCKGLQVPVGIQRTLMGICLSPFLPFFLAWKFNSTCKSLEIRTRDFGHLFARVQRIFRGSLSGGTRRSYAPKWRDQSGVRSIQKRLLRSGDRYHRGCDFPQLSKPSKAVYGLENRYGRPTSPACLRFARQKEASSRLKPGSDVGRDSGDVWQVAIAHEFLKYSLGFVAQLSI